MWWNAHVSRMHAYPAPMELRQEQSETERWIDSRAKIDTGCQREAKMNSVREKNKFLGCNHIGCTSTIYIKLSSQHYRIITGLYVTVTETHGWFLIW